MFEIVYEFVGCLQTPRGEIIVYSKVFAYQMLMQNRTSDKAKEKPQSVIQRKGEYPI